MSSHISTTYLNNALGTDVVTALASGSALSQWISAASAMVDTALVNAGYDVPATANDTVKLATLGALLPMLHGARKGISVPPALAEQVTGLWRAIATGEVQIPGMTPTSRDGVGGVKFSDQDEDSTDGRPSIFHGRLGKVF